VSFASGGENLTPVWNALRRRARALNDAFERELKETSKAERSGSIRFPARFIRTDAGVYQIEPSGVVDPRHREI